jgi:pyridoxamine 5'-phosphate oxidase
VIAPFSSRGTLKSTRISTFFPLIGKSLSVSMGIMEFSRFRKDYSLSTLRKNALSDNPFEQLHLWIEEAKNEIEPNAVQLATCLNNLPSIRTVLIKEITPDGLIFFTHAESRKGNELLANPHAALLFLWKSLERQVIIEGATHLCSEAKSAAYFASRPRESQLGTLVSHQGDPIPSREALEAAYKKLEQAYEGKEVPPPKDWRGFCVVPHRFEFWQGGSKRLHDRFQYTLNDKNWEITRLSP